MLPLQTWREQFDVNLFGQVAVIKALLPALRRSRGRIVNITSVGGEVALPNYSAYAATKFALEAVSDSLRREVAAQGIQVVIVQSGGVKTPMAERSGPLSLELAEQMSPEHKRLYQDMVTSAVDSQTAFLTYALTAEKAVARIARITTTRRTRARYPPGADARFSLPMNRPLPTRLMDRILAR